MIRPPPRSTRTDTLLPYTTLFLSPSVSAARCHLPMASPQGGSNDWYRPSASPARTIVAHVPMQPSPPPPVDPVSRGDRRHIMEWGFMTIRGTIPLASVLAWRSQQDRVGYEGVIAFRSRGTTEH